MHLTITVGNKVLDLEEPKVMGILNVTSDSFYEGSRNPSIDQALHGVESMLEDGADIIDVGGFSTRPGANVISRSEETERLIPVIKAILSRFPDAVLSIDTFRAEVAERSIETGAHIINDISGGTLDSRMFETVARLNVPYILMHMRGTPQTMQHLTNYENLMSDITDFIGNKVARLRQMGVRDLIIDPGLGFAKTLEQNFQLLDRFEELHIFGLPVLGAISRKSMIYKELNITTEQALNGTTVLNTLLLMKGAKILRVHDVKEAKEAIALTKRLTLQRSRV